MAGLHTSVIVAAAAAAIGAVLALFVRRNEDVQHDTRDGSAQAGLTVSR